MGHEGCVYSAVWSPRQPQLFASASADGTVKLWDAKMPQPIQTIFAHANECLSLDWNKYADMTIVTASVDQTIKVRQLLMLNKLIFNRCGI